MSPDNQSVVSVRALLFGIAVLLWSLSATAVPRPTSDWLQVAADGVLATGSSPAVVRDQAVLDVFVRGTDNHLWHVAGKEGSWSGWRRDPNGVFTGDPIAVSTGGGRARVFVRGLDNKIWYVDYYAGTFSLWKTACPAGILANDSNPAVALVNGAVEFFIRGTDNGLWHARFDGESCSGWTRHPSVIFNGDPAIGDYGSSSVTALFRGQDTRLWAANHSAGGWGGTYQVDPNGLLGSSPSTLAFAFGYEVFIRGMNQREISPLWAYASWERSWQPIPPESFLFAGRPALTYTVREGRAQIDMFVNGPGNRLWYRTFTELLPPG